MFITKLPIGSIVEDTFTNCIFEITNVNCEETAKGNIYRYDIGILVNPTEVVSEKVMITTIDQLNRLHFFNLIPETDEDSGLVNFVVSTLDEEDTAKLCSLEIFLRNFFSKKRHFRRKTYFYEVIETDIENRRVKVKREANLIEKFFYNTGTIIKDIEMVELFEEFTLLPD